jgi:2-keto-4-pentenoate hydratase
MIALPISAAPAQSATAPADISAIAAEIFATLGTARQVKPFTVRPAGLTVDDAYRVSAALNGMREARGETPLGRKIGFTNRTIWPEYGVYAPIWGFVYDSTVHELDATAALSLAGFAEPRIEPEIVFGLAAAPSTRRRYSPASTGSRTASSSCSRSIRSGSSPPPTPSPPTASTARC